MTVQPDKRIDYVEKDRAILDALASLLRDKDINDISVKDIASASHVSRGTFYLHFEDKYAALERLEGGLVDELLEINRNLPTFDFSNHDEALPYPFFEETYAWVRKRRDRIAPLLGQHGDRNFEARWKRIIVDYFRRLLRANSVSSRYTDLVYRAIAATLMEFIRCYATTEEVISPAEMSRVSGRIIHGIVDKFSK